MGKGVYKIDGIGSDGFDCLEFFYLHLISKSSPFVGNLIDKKNRVFITGD